MEILFHSEEEIGMFELKRDAIFSRIPPERYEELISFGWHTGEAAAQEFIKKTGTSIPSEMASRLNLQVKSENWDSGQSNVRVYSEYEDKIGRITLHPNVISAGMKAAESHGFDQVKTYAAARELFLAHEIFHYLECRELGLTFQKKKIVTFRLGPVKITSGMRALSEIAAHAFTKTLYELNHGYPELQSDKENED